MTAKAALVYQTQQIRLCEQLAKERYALSGTQLMERAGNAAFIFLTHRFLHARRIAVFCGAGNNGGDGYVVARLAKQHGLQVIVWQVGDHTKLQGEALQAFSECQQASVTILPFNFAADLQHPDLIVDAICGIGIKNSLRSDVVLALQAMQHQQVPIFSLDVPTGVDADTGALLGAAIQATATMTFIGLKLGLLTGDGIACAGELVLHELELPDALFASITPCAEKMYYPHFLPPRPRAWHKGLSGHVLVIGGEKGFAGAPRMAAEAALRVGAGLVTVATRPEHVLEMNIGRPEIMCHGVTKPDDLLPLIAKAAVIVIGPGLGQTDWARSIWEYIKTQDKPLVVDADALNLLAKNPTQSPLWILTPHPGEASRLLEKTVITIQQDRLTASLALVKRYGGVSVLKGAGSIIVTEQALPAICDKGNPGMATAGMGDVLSGVIGGLVAQGVTLADAAKWGVYMHAEAGDLAAQAGERGMIATDLLPYLRQLSNK